LKTKQNPKNLGKNACPGKKLDIRVNENGLYAWVWLILSWIGKVGRGRKKREWEENNSIEHYLKVRKEI